MVAHSSSDRPESPESPTAWDTLDSALTQRTGQAQPSVEAQDPATDIRAALSTAEDVPTDVNVTFHALVDRLKSNTRSAPSLKTPHIAGAHHGFTKRARTAWRGVALSCGGLAVLLLAWVFTNSTAPDTGVSRTIVTNTAQGASLTLLDGTHVTLAQSTTLRLIHFGKRQRMVAVDGEAYFEVPKLAGGAPFTVQSGGVVTRVLGTSFLVRHDGAQGNAHIAVTDGKVSVTAPSMQRTLTAGDIVDATDSTVKVSTIEEMTPGVGWEDGKIVFHRTPVPAVLAALTRWYGLQFKCADPAINKQSVTVLINPSSSSAALSKLEQVLDVNLTVLGDTVTLAPRPVQSQAKVPRMRAYDVWVPHNEVGR